MAMRKETTGVPAKVVRMGCFSFLAMVLLVFLSAASGILSIDVGALLAKPEAGKRPARRRWLVDFEGVSVLLWKWGVIRARMRTFKARERNQRAEGAFTLHAYSPADSRRFVFVGGVIGLYTVVVGRVVVVAVVAALTIPGSPSPSPISCRKPPMIKDSPMRAAVDPWRAVERRTMKDRRDSWRTLIALVKT
jgi:hypothetical protein